MTDHAGDSETRRRRLAIIGGGSSGLVCLKLALDTLANWEIFCFEKSDRITGCWGNPYPGFVSTSTKYTTQFACFPVFDGDVIEDAGQSREEFFRDGEYGQYLEQFAQTFGLHAHITLNCHVERMQRSETGVGWELSLHRTVGENRGVKTENFDAIVICTGLAATPKPIERIVKTIPFAELNQPEGLGHVTDKRIVVIGGGESAVDYANRLSRPELCNQVYLSLHSGIRVSPRYHPIRGVPSDFLRNRLLLSVHADIRNWLGQIFVQWRIKYQEQFQRLFPGRQPDGTTNIDPRPDVENQTINHRKAWAYKLTKTAKDDLFNMFHNKSDDFLEAVGDGRITIVGPAVDDQHNCFRQFDSDETVTVTPDLIVPAIGYQSNLEKLSDGAIQLTEFYLGCCHVRYPDTFLVGFARPIIGNIPTISEMQARFVCGLISGDIKRDAAIEQLNESNLAGLRKRYAKLNLESTHPVEMIPYCDQLARMLGISPTPRAVGSLSSWWRMQLVPASTMHYFAQDPKVRERLESAPIYMPLSLIIFVLVMKPVDLIYRLIRQIGILRIGK